VGIRGDRPPGVHYYKLVEGDAIYDPDIYGGPAHGV